MAKRVVILGYASSVHIIRWANAIAGAGFDVHLVSLGGEPVPGIDTTIIAPGKFRRLSYITNLFRVKRLIRNLNPDILHSHYATGYGLWGAFSGTHPFILSVWGSDVIDYPNSPLKRLALRKVLLAADHITATSEYLKSRTENLIPKRKVRIDVVPFGVGLPTTTSLRHPDGLIKLVYIKAHKKKYGPDVLIKAMRFILNKLPNIRLTIAGEGEMTAELKSMARKLDLEKVISFVGFIENAKILSVLSQHDIMVMPSILESESFGVAAIEAASCELPVVASRIGGIPEVVRDGETGLLVSPGDPGGLADAIIGLASDPNLMKKLGMAGRKFVAENYRWDDNIKQMTELYKSMIKN